MLFASTPYTQGLLFSMCSTTAVGLGLAAQPDLVTPVLQALIERFGSAAYLNIHLHCLVLDGVYRSGADGVPVFIEAGAPTADERDRAAVGLIGLEPSLPEQVARNDAVHDQHARS